jgi:invasion protein IalB
MLMGFVAAGFGVAIDAVAQEPKAIGRYGEWVAYTVKAQKQLVCYIASQPTKEKGKYKRRGDVFARVSHRPAAKSFGVVSFVAGYTYKQDSDVLVSIGGNEFTLYTDAGTAWADDKLDRKLVAAMKAGRTMEVRGTSSRGTLTKDTYSLAGFTRAHQEIGKACKVK